MKRLLDFKIVVYIMIGCFFAQAQTPEKTRREAVRDSLLRVKAERQAVLTGGAPVRPVQQPGPLSVSVVPVMDSLPISDSVMVEALNIKDTEIRDLLQGMAIQYKLNLFMANDVKGPVSVNFSKIPLKKALRILMDENGYEMRVESGAIKIKKMQPKQEQAPQPKNRFIVSFNQGKLSLDLEQIPVEQVVRKLVETTGVNMVVDASATGPVSAFLKDMELAKALRTLAESNRFQVVERDGVWMFSREASLGSSDAVNGKAWVKVKDGKISIEAVDAPLQQVLASLTQQTGVGTVVYGKITGSVTARMENITLEDALKYLFRGTGFTYWTSGGVYFIGPHEMQTSSNSMLLTLKHMKAEEALKLLPPSLTKDAQIQVVKSQNALMVVGAYENMDALREYVDKMDLPIPQILVEALVVDVDIEKARQYGVDLFLGKASKVASSEALYPSFDQVLNQKQSSRVLDKVGLGDVVSLPKDFVARVQAMEQEKVLNVKARSQIATLNGETAVLTIGQTQYFLLKSETDYNQGTSVTNKSTERFEKVEANATLTVTPYVTGKGEVTCEIVPDFSEPEGSFNSSVPPTLNKRYVKASVRLRNGETIILGGMVKESVNNVNTQVPFLGSIPIIGYLFKNVNQVKSRSQLLIYVTPTIYYGSEGKVDLEKELKKLEK